jgi:hypothetical protein
MQLSYPPFNEQDRIRRPVVRAAAIAACVLLAGAVIAAPPRSVPDFAAVAQSVEAYFDSLPDYEHGDLINRSQVEAALKNVESDGWKVPQAKELTELALTDKSFLVRELATPAGKRFMRKISRQNGAYSRLDRLSTIPRGQTIVRDLVRQPGGEKLIQYLGSSSGGHKMGAQLGQVRGGVDLNKPTGRIYTADDLLAELKRVHETTTR